MELLGETCCEPFACTPPMPSMLTLVASWVDQVRVAVPPRSMLSGLTLRVALGWGGGGAAGGAGGTCFFLQPPTTTIAAKDNTKKVHFILSIFQIILQNQKRSPCPTSRTRRTVTGLNLHYTHCLQNSSCYFQLQFGCELEPPKVNWVCWLPSASMDHICSPPPRVD